jgi:predicted CoA-binding protein
MITSHLEQARAFLASKRIAVLGVSREPKDFSRLVYRELLKRGLDAVPVNPALEEAEGRRAVPHVRDLAPAADAALLLIPASRAEEVVRECVAAGVRSIWFHRGGGAGAASEAALALCRSSDVEVVQGLCPFMAWPDAALPHRLHGMLRCAFGQRPPAP